MGGYYAPQSQSKACWMLNGTCGHFRPCLLSIAIDRKVHRQIDRQTASLGELYQHIALPGLVASSGTASFDLSLWNQWLFPQLDLWFGRNLENQQRAAAGLTTTGSYPLCSNAPHEHQDNADEEERIMRQRQRQRHMPNINTPPHKHQANCDQFHTLNSHLTLGLMPKLALNCNKQK